MPMSCPPDCGWCCTHLVKPRPRAQAEAEAAFVDELRAHGVYRCDDAPDTGLSLTNAEASRLLARAKERRVKADIHPRTFLLDTRRRRTVVVDWHLAHASCPFYEDFRCTVYDDRPLPCRAYPVYGLGPRWILAPECPRVEAEAWGRESRKRFFAVEAEARKALEAQHAALDEAFALTMRDDLRFATGLSRREALARARRYRIVPMEEVVRRTPATSSTN